MIPKLLHFVWIGPQMPDWAADNVRLFRRLNPDFLCQVHGEESLLPFLRPVYEAIEGDHLWSRRSDILRISVLLQHGGWYLDTDFLPLRPLAEVYRDQANFPRGTYLAHGDNVTLRHVFSEEESQQRQWIANGVIGTTADSAFLACALRGILMGHIQLQRTWDCYGPRLFTEIAEQYPGIAHVGRMDDWFRLPSVPERRAAYRRIRDADYKLGAIHSELGTALPYAFHQSMQDEVEL
jgi:hypothetical protein